ncbi:PolC-type DNA polymerase III [Microaerobacter geothermalis]|uniref:PolC-type DNA polymerase III n=1 Tax=Microaerobacter geothermalis TaxID=674972 RepID=UPI002E344426|nr:PolC-type DNA polymerase III [Microaerobacter geothermalis]
METRDEGKKRFHVLMSQLQLPEEISTYFSGGILERLILSKKNKSWIFQILLPKLLPVNVYQIFIQRLRTTFHFIDKVDCQIRYVETVKLSYFFNEYWLDMKQQLSQSINSTTKILNEWEYDEAKKKLFFFVPNEVHLDFMKKKEVAKKIEEYIYHVIGENVPVSFCVRENEEMIEQFQTNLMKEDKNLAQEAMTMREQAANPDKNMLVQPVNFDQLIGYEIKDDPVPLKSIIGEDRRVTIQGVIFESELRELKSGRYLLNLYITDYTDSILVKIFSKDSEDIPSLKSVKNGDWIKVRGNIQYDTFERDLVMLANDANRIPRIERVDDAEEKRVELHLHTTMSAMDAVTSVSKLIEQAAKWGHKAIAVTDHSVVQAFPEAYYAGKKNGIKIIYGVEANVINDSIPIVHQPEEREITDDTYVIFDIETTGLSVVNHQIIELAGVKMKGGKVIDRFESFVNPHEKLPENIISLTHITDEMLKGAPELEEVLSEFIKFIEGCTLVAHNARFDMGFIQQGCKKIGMDEVKNPVLDTLELARFLYPDMKNHRLNTLAEKFQVTLENHHRAVDDAAATGLILWEMIKDLSNRNIKLQHRLNDFVGKDYQNARPFHCNVYAKNEVGKKNLYRLVSLAHTTYLNKTPRIPKSILEELREGLIISSGCEKGELFETVLNKSLEEAEEVAKFYDVLEIQPVQINLHLVDKKLVESELVLIEANRKIVSIGEKLGKPVVATGNVHYLHPEDKMYREILIHGITGFSPLKDQRKPDVHFRTTNEMLEEFLYLGEEKAKEVVIINPSKIADQVEELQIIPDKLFPPKIEGADEEIRSMSYNRAKSIYGEPLPEIVEQRLEKELNSIITHGFSVIYLISHKLVKNSLDNGYLVGSRGSVGSSFVATMTQITEVNPLPPHYVCLSCHYSEWFTKGEYGSGFDLPNKDCPKCGTPLKGDGHDIPFETFLGFKGDKVPDIDLNFSGEYQAHAHNYTKVLFGEDYVYRAGTIGTVAEKTAFGFTKKYMEEKKLQWRQAEIKRLAYGCTGAKRTTGQHPGGIIVVPNDMDIYDFCPIQYPADDKTSEWKTTHYDFHSIHDNLLKLDILGHDDPTVIRMLQDLTGVDPETIPITDEKIMQLFSGTEVLGVTPEQINSNVGTYGIPEFGTKFVRQMLEETKPSTFAELVQISGLSHGTDVWLNNAQELIHSGIALKDVIGCRDDIMVYLIHKGLEPSRAFKIMEKVRKGKGLDEEDISYMKEFQVPDWYIGSCQKIKYMFPKAHATAYVLMALRIAYFKVYYPAYFYATYFTVRADDFDLELAIKGSDAIRKRIDEITEMGNQASPKEKNLLTILEMCLEMLERGFFFQSVDLYRSHATHFLVDGNILIPPFNSIPGVGTNAALNIAKAREKGEFLSKEDLQERARVSKPVLDLLEKFNCLNHLPDTNQLTLF